MERNQTGWLPADDSEIEPLEAADEGRAAEGSVGDVVTGEAPGPVPAENTGEDANRIGPDADTMAAAGDWQGDEFEDKV